MSRDCRLNLESVHTRAWNSGPSPGSAAGVAGEGVGASLEAVTSSRSALPSIDASIAVAATGAVRAGLDKFKLTGAGLAEKGDGRIAEAELAIVLDHLPHHPVGIVRVVQPEENLADHLLLILAEGGAHAAREEGAYRHLVTGPAAAGDHGVRRIQPLVGQPREVTVEPGAAPELEPSDLGIVQYPVGPDIDSFRPDGSTSSQIA